MFIIIIIIIISEEVYFPRTEFQEVVRGRGGSVGRASASRSNGFHDQRFELNPVRSTRNNCESFSESKMLC